MKFQYLAFLVLISCQSFDFPDFFEGPPAPVRYKDVLPPAHPLAKLFDANIPEIQDFGFIYQLNTQFPFTAQSGAKVVLLENSLAPEYVGKRLFLKIEEVLDPLAVQGAEISLWFRERTVFESGGMLRTSIMDEEGNSVPVNPRTPLVIRWPRVTPGMNLFSRDDRGLWQESSQPLMEAAAPGEGITLDPGFFQVTWQGVEPTNIFYHGRLASIFENVIEQQGEDLDVYWADVDRLGWRSGARFYPFDMEVGIQYWVKRRTTLTGVYQWTIPSEGVNRWWNIDILNKNTFLINIHEIESPSEKKVLYGVNFATALDSYEINTSGEIPVFRARKQVILIVDEDGAMFRSRPLMPSTLEEFSQKIQWTKVSPEQVSNNERFYELLERSQTEYTLVDLPSLNRF